MKAKKWYDIPMIPFFYVYKCLNKLNETLSSIGILIFSLYPPLIISNIIGLNVYKEVGSDLDNDVKIIIVIVSWIGIVLLTKRRYNVKYYISGE